MPFSTLEIWEAFLEKGQADAGYFVDDIHQLLVDHAGVTWFDIDLANGCNLTCNHCFYHDKYSEWSQPGLLPEQVQQVAQQAFQSGIKVLTFSGKEPTLNRQLESIIGVARQERQTYAPHAKIGMITNGLTLDRYLDFFEKEPLDFIDVSVDGWVQHNVIRSNTRDRVIANLQSAKQRLSATRVGTSTVIRNDNHSDILTMVENLASFITDFYFEPVVAAVDKSVPSLTEENLVTFVIELRKLASKFHDRNLRFSILLNGSQTLPLYYRGLLQPEDIEEDEFGSLYIRHRFGSVQIDHILRVVPEYYWRAARLSYDGYWLGSCDLLQAPNFREFAVGNFNETPDFQTLFKRSLKKDSLFYRAMEELFSKPCQHTPRERQYCLYCFSDRLVKMMHRSFNRRSVEMCAAA